MCGFCCAVTSNISWLFQELIPAASKTVKAAAGRSGETRELVTGLASKLTLDNSECVVMRGISSNFIDWSGNVGKTGSGHHKMVTEEDYTGGYTNIYGFQGARLIKLDTSTNNVSTNLAICQR